MGEFRALGRGKWSHRWRDSRCAPTVAGGSKRRRLTAEALSAQREDLNDDMETKKKLVLSAGARLFLYFLDDGYKLLQPIKCAWNRFQISS